VYWAVIRYDPAASATVPSSLARAGEPCTCTLSGWVVGTNRRAVTPGGRLVSISISAPVSRQPQVISPRGES
jgi:hypothetical protein